MPDSGTKPWVECEHDGIADHAVFTREAFEGHYKAKGWSQSTNDKGEPIEFDRPPGDESLDEELTDNSRSAEGEVVENVEAATAESAEQAADDAAAGTEVASETVVDTETAGRRARRGEEGA